MNTLSIDEGIRILNDGGIVVFPTDTAWGIGCRIDDEAAVTRLYGIRERPETQPLPVLACGREQGLGLFLEPSFLVRHLALAWWPGDCTVVYRADDSRVPAIVRGGASTVGVRVPAHPTAIALIQGTGVPLTGPSANIHGRETPYVLRAVDPELLSRTDGIVMGDDPDKGRSSTVIDASSYPPAIIREGSAADMMPGRGKGIELHIDTTGSQTLTVALFADREHVRMRELSRDRSEPLLSVIDALLSDAGHAAADIRRITVAPGPGSFTGIRVGMTVGKALALTNGVTLNGTPPDQTADPVYGQSTYDP